MKKLLALLLAVLMLAALCACGETETTTDTTAATTADAESENVTETAVDESGDLQVEETAVADASGGDVYVLTDEEAENGNLNEEKYQLALECMGESVDVLYDTIGEPEGEPHYASSCMEMDAEDGQLYYDADGFYVTTLKNADGETVMGVVVYD